MGGQALLGILGSPPPGQRTLGGREACQGRVWVADPLPCRFPKEISRPTVSPSRAKQGEASGGHIPIKGVPDPEACGGTKPPPPKLAGKDHGDGLRRLELTVHRKKNGFHDPTREL
ncbi:UNVERIFIED_CONTAM: hypothetical protein K2H54_073970 [Gekko kuhli]